MRKSTSCLWSGTAGAILLGVGVMWSAQGSLAQVLKGSISLFINGKLASNRVIMRDGEAYAPIRDMASALGMSIARGANGYSLSQAGGANQVEGVNGKVGQVLFNGKYRFEVLKVFRGQNYTKQFDPTHMTIGTGPNVQSATPNGMDIVAITCRLKNGAKRSYGFSLLGGTHTALTDTDEHAYQPPTGGWADVSNGNPELLPGAAADFAITFIVPPNAQLKDLVYTPNPIGDPNPGSDFRVSLEGATIDHQQ